MKRLIFAGLFCFAFAASAWALGPSTQPTTQTSPEQIDQFIKELGDSDFKVREDASASLQKVGEAAIPKLEEATQSDDPEVSSRARGAIAAIQRKNQPVQTVQNPQGMPGVAVGRVMIGGGQLQVGGNVVIRVEGGIANPGNRETVATENGKQYRIKQDATGILVSVTEQKDGKEVTTDYKAKTVEELKKDSPEGYKIYEKYSAQNTQPAPVAPPVAPVAPPVPPAPRIELKIENN